MKFRSSLIAVFFPFACSSPASAQPAQIQINASRVINSVSPYLGTGACLEDVNHEVYGGIYSQMIFGESFQEPSFVLTSFQRLWRRQRLRKRIGCYSNAKFKFE